MATMQQILVVFLITGGLVFLGFVIAVIARLFQYRDYASGKYFQEYFPRSLVLEIIYTVIAGVVIFGGGILLVLTDTRSTEPLWISAGVSLLIGGAMLYRGLRVAVQGIAPQARAFGIDTVRSGTMTGPLRAVSPMDKLVVARLDTDNSLPD